LAEHGLAWYYFDHEKYREALQVFKSLSREENRHQWLRAFGLAGICIIQGSNINQGGGNQVEFENAYSQLGDVKLLDKLRDADPRMATLLDQVTESSPDTKVD